LVLWLKGLPMLDSPATIDLGSGTISFGKLGIYALRPFPVGRRGI
jgi:hypothetical protein